MPREDTKSKSQSKKHRPKQVSSSESESSNSDEDSPPRHQKRQKERHSSYGNRKEKAEKHQKRKHEKEKLSESSDESTSPPKQRKKDGQDRKHDSRHHHEDSSRSKHFDKDKSGRNHHRRDDEKHKQNSDSKRERSPVMRIKQEEEFDRRQEKIRQKRRRDDERGERNPYHIKVKQERLSDEEGRRDRRDRKGNRNRNDIERERRANDARRAEAWQKRERQGGQNAEALLEDTSEPKEKEKPNLGLSGALTEDTNTYRGVVIKYSEPPEAKVPTKKWRLYPFKGDEALKVLHLHRQSAYLLGKLRRIADIPIDHPSCSKQHAVFQFRLVEQEREDGTKKRIVKPYIIDLDSANGTFVNNQKIQPRRYVELKEKDVLKFAFSSREYVLIHDKSDTTGVDVSGEENSDED